MIDWKETLGDAMAAKFALDDAINFLGKESRLYPGLKLAREVIEMAWMGAADEIQGSREDSE